MKPPCPLAFASLESAIESTSPLIVKEWRDSVYLLLWELGTNILKYGINNLYASVSHSHLPSQKISLSKYLLDSTNSLHIITYYLPQGTLYLAFYYLVALPKFYLVSKPTLHTAPLTLYAQDTTLDSTHHHNNLGHKVIQRYAKIFCYNAPKFTITSARHRTISMTIKGRYLAI